MLHGRHGELHYLIYTLILWSVDILSHTALYFLERSHTPNRSVNFNPWLHKDGILMTGMHSLCDIFFKRWKHMVYWIHAKVCELSQKYTEVKLIIVKILHGGKWLLRCKFTFTIAKILLEDLIYDFVEWKTFDITMSIIDNDISLSMVCARKKTINVYKKYIQCMFNILSYTIIIYEDNKSY